MFVPKLLAESEYVQSLACNCSKRGEVQCGIMYRQGA